MTPEERASAWIRDHASMAAKMTIERSAFDALAAAIRDAENDALERAAGHLETLAKNTPVGHEDRQRGASTYNWLKTHAGIVRKLKHKTTKD